MTSATRLSLIVPCYNEAKNLPAVLERCRRLISAAREVGAEAEVVLVDNGSTDDTQQVLAELLPMAEGCRTIRVEVNAGYGRGILAGLEVAEGDILGWTHADFQTDPLDAIAGLAIFKAADHPQRLFVKGNRKGRPISDVVFTAAMSAFETLLMGCVLRDVNAQPTMFHREFFQDWRGPPSDFSLDLYAYRLAKGRKLSVERIPVVFGDRLHGTSHWNTSFSNKWKFIRRTISYSFKLRFSGL